MQFKMKNVPWVSGQHKHIVYSKLQISEGRKKKVSCSLDFFIPWLTVLGWKTEGSLDNWLQWKAFVRRPTSPLWLGWAVGGWVRVQWRVMTEWATAETSHPHRTLSRSQRHSPCVNSGDPLEFSKINWLIIKLLTICWTERHCLLHKLTQVLVCQIIYPTFTLSIYSIQEPNWFYTFWRMTKNNIQK